MKYYQLLSLTLLCMCWFACKPSGSDVKEPDESQLEAREDSIQLAEALALQGKITKSVTADVETKAVRTGDVNDDAADDMAIWINRANPEKSVIIGANKKGGVAVYNMDGEEIAFYPTGRINNIDVMYDYDLHGELVDLVGCSNRSEQSIDLFRIHADSFRLSDIASHALLVDTNKVKDVYGFCFYKSTRPYLFINGKNGMMQQFELITTNEKKVDVKLMREVAFNSQTEGMVADEEYKIVYVGEEDKGIWKLGAEPNSGDARTLIKMSGEENPNITFDIEGLTIYKNGRDGYLIASSQGNFSYAVFGREDNNPYLGSFKIIDGPVLDGVEETDGIDAISSPLGDKFPRGVFAVQDGFNYDGDTLRAQNFKLVDWEKIQEVIKK